MPVNAGIAYGIAEQEYLKARTNQEKLAALQKMLQTAPKHKSSENLLKDLKNRIARLKETMVKEKKAAKSSSGSFFSVKKEGAAQVVIVGTVNSGKSTLLKALTHADVEIASYPFTTKKPEVGVMDYHGVKIQVVEIPAVVKDFGKTQHGPAYLSIMKQADLMILMFRSPEEKKLLDKELADVQTPFLIYNAQEDLADEVWKRLHLMKVYTKQPGKERDYPPLALQEKSTVRDVAEKVHKDFVKRFKFARIFGSSVKFRGIQVGLDHVLVDQDVVEFHLH